MEGLRPRPNANLTLAAAALVFAITAPLASALDPRLAITQYRREVWHAHEGLPQNSVEAIAQTSDGYLWLGTQEGLARFDGLRFTVFDKSNTQALRHNRITALLADRSGRLFIGTEGGGVSVMQDGAFTAYGAAEGLPSPLVRSFAQEAGGALWVGTDAGLARFEAGRFVAGPRDAALDGHRILSLCAGRSGLWVGVEDGVFGLRDGKLERLANSPELRAATALWEDVDGTLWIGTLQGLFSRAPGARDVTRAAVTLPNPHLSTILRDRDGSLWLGTDAGASRVARDGSVSVLSGGQGLSADRVLQVFEDREGSVWLGVQDGGLTRLSTGKFTTWSAAEGLGGDIVWPVFRAHDGSIWVGTKTGGLSHLRDSGIETLTTRNGLSADAVQSIAQDKDGVLWVGARGAGLNRVENGRARAVPGFAGQSINSLYFTRDGRLFVGTRNALCVYANGACGPGSATGSFPAAAPISILEGRDGTLWVGTNGGGLVRIKDGATRVFTTRDGLTSDIVNIVHEDASGTLWIGTYGGGLNRLRGERFTAYTTAEGLYDDAIFSILEDEHERLWMSCNKGVFRVDKQEIEALDRKAVARLHPVAYGVEDGMKNRECNGANFPPAAKDGKGRLYFPTLEGVVAIDPEQIRTNPIPPPVNLDQFVVDGRSYATHDGIELAPGARNLEFHYAAPSFVAPARVRYRYRLEGLDTEWVDAGARRVAYYSRLPPGAFRFRVIAANDDGLWNEEGASLAFRLRPRPYQTPWFAALCALGLGAAVWGGDRWRTRRRAAREAALERLVEERTRELAEANQRLERLSALDGLTAVANRRRFDEALGVEWRRACRSGEPLSLVLLDLDFFKPFNDSRGHLAGDEALRQVARFLSESLGRAGDLVARFGGEEFVALLPNMDPAGAAVFAERLRAGVEALAIPHGASSVAPVVTLSAGVATTAPDERRSPSSLLAAADAALYQAKREGRNGVVRMLA